MDFPQFSIATFDCQRVTMVFEELQVWYTHLVVAKCMEYNSSSSIHLMGHS